MMRRRTPAPPALPQARLLIPVLGATGGTGRSTLAYLLAAHASAHARTLVLDTCAPLASPWQKWQTRPGTTSGAPVSDGPVTAQTVFAAAATVATGTGEQFSVLTTQARQGAATASDGLGEQQRLVDLFAPRVALIDTDLPLLTALSIDEQQPTAAPLGWLTVSDAAPVLCAPASGKGVSDLLATVHALRERDLATVHLTVAVVGIATADLPRRVQAGLTLLEPLVRGIVRLPHEPRLHATGSPSWARTSPRLRTAVEQLLYTAVPEPSTTSTTVSEARDPIPTVQPLGAPTPTAGGTDALAHPC